jgi:L-histidine N-alpha-methyltransferase
MLIGVDLSKDHEILDAAYNDKAGVTAAFNLNLLERINRELSGDFDLSRFEHVAFFNPVESRIEIYIESQVAQLVHVAGRGFRLNAGERIHTEYSYKYTSEMFRALARSAGWTSLESWVDDDQLFSVHYLRRL